jgi:voltage-gated potassium channel
MNEHATIELETTQTKPAGRSQSAEMVTPYQFFMLGLCFYVLIALGTEALVSLDPETRAILRMVDHAICIVFFLDFCISLIRAPDKLAYLKWGWIDLLSSIPTIEALRVGRAVRILRIIRILRGVRSTTILVKFLLRRRAESAFMTAALTSILLILFSSVAILHVETTAESNITTADDAVWWAFATITTVGYGDRYPVTAEGRLLAACLMSAGVGLFGIFTGFVASSFLSPGEEEQENELQHLRQELAEIKQLLKDREPVA